jgi:hypothetical protein
MSHELFYTSSPSGLKPGSKGFCTVAMTQGLSAQFAERLESLSGYRFAFEPGSAQAALNPVQWAHWRVTVAGKTRSVLSRVASAGADYSGRSNKFAHHLVLEPGEQSAGGPAWLMKQPALLAREWAGKPAWIPTGRPVPAGDRKAGVCGAWATAAGDAGWGGVLAESFLKEPNKPAVIIGTPQTDFLYLFEEAIALLPASHRWQVTFSTYFTDLPAGLICAWRGVLAESAVARDALKQPGRFMVIDLTSEPGMAPTSPLVELARSGSAKADANLPAVFAPGILAEQEDASIELDESAEITTSVATNRPRKSLVSSQKAPAQVAAAGSLDQSWMPPLGSTVIERGSAREPARQRLSPMVTILWPVTVAAGLLLGIFIGNFIGAASAHHPSADSSKAPPATAEPAIAIAPKPAAPPAVAAPPPKRDNDATKDSTTNKGSIENPEAKREIAKSMAVVSGSPLPPADKQSTAMQHIPKPPKPKLPEELHFSNSFQPDEDGTLQRAIDSLTGPLNVPNLMDHPVSVQIKLPFAPDGKHFTLRNNDPVSGFEASVSPDGTALTIASSDPFECAKVGIAKNQLQIRWLDGCSPRIKVYAFFCLANAQYLVSGSQDNQELKQSVTFDSHAFPIFSIPLASTAYKQSEIYVPINGLRIAIPSKTKPWRFTPQLIPPPHDTFWKAPTDSREGVQWCGTGHLTLASQLDCPAFFSCINHNGQESLTFSSGVTAQALKQKISADLTAAEGRFRSFESQIKEEAEKLKGHEPAERCKELKKNAEDKLSQVKEGKLKMKEGDLIALNKEIAEYTAVIKAQDKIDELKPKQAADNSLIVNLKTLQQGTLAELELTLGDTPPQVVHLGTLRITLPPK